MLEIIDKNNKQAYVHIDNLENLTMQGIRQGWFRLGKSLRDNLRTEMLKKNKRGRVYTRRIRGGVGAGINHQLRVKRRPVEQVITVKTWDFS